MRNLTATLCLTIAVLLGSAGMNYAFSQDLIEKTKIHKDAKKTQNLKFLTNLRKSEIYNFVGKGTVNFSRSFLKKYDKFTSHSNPAFLYATPDGKKGGWSWCRGSACDRRYIFSDDVRSYIEDKCASKWRRTDCVLVAVGENVDLNLLDEFQGKVVWDFKRK